MKKVLLILICFITFNVSALEIKSEKAVLYNLNDNQIVFNKEADTKTPIASLTKIMTCLVSIEHINSLDDKVVITKEMLKGLIEDNLYVAGLKEGQEVTYKDLLYATFLPSGADGANALAYSIGKTKENFVKMMNDKAQELGLIHTHFANPTGLDNDDNYSTANEVAKLLKEALNNKIFYEMLETSKYKLSDSSLTVESSLRHTSETFHLDTNYIIGAKTGYTDDAGRCLASVAYDKENDIKYLLVTINAPTSQTKPYHVLDAINIYSYYFNNYKYYNVISEGDKILSLPVKYGLINSLDFYSHDDIKFYSNKHFDKSKVILEYNGLDIITPKIKLKDKVGTIKVKYDNQEVKDIDIYLEETIKYSIYGYIVLHKYQLIFIIILLMIIDILLIIKRYKKIRFAINNQ